jgi:NADPH-dependent curcumin reductase CurA
MKSNCWVVASNPTGPVAVSNFDRIERELPSLQEGEALVKVGTVGIEPALNFRMRAGGNFPALRPGNPVPSSAVGIVVESKKPGFEPGDYVYGSFGWQEHVIVGLSSMYCARLGHSGEPLTNARGIMGEAAPSPTGPYSLEDYLGILGGAGVDAWFSVFEFGRLQPGETLLVTGAAGGIGSICGQLAAIHGATAIGTTRDLQKREWLTDHAGFAHSVVLKCESFVEELRRHAPRGIDLLIDNAAGWQTSAAIPALARKARLVICGAIAGYQSNTNSTIPLEPIVFQDLQVIGFFGDHYLDRWTPALDRLGALLSARKLEPLYNMRQGFDVAPQAYCNLYEGNTNRGKLMVQFSEI